MRARPESTAQAYQVKSHQLVASVIQIDCHQGLDGLYALLQNIQA